MFLFLSGNEVYSINIHVVYFVETSCILYVVFILIDGQEYKFDIKRNRFNFLPLCVTCSKLKRKLMCH